MMTTRIFKLLSLLALTTAHSTHQQPIALRRHRLQSRTPKTRQLQLSSTVLLSTTLGACDDPSPTTEPYKIGDFLKVCITVVDPANTITSLQDVYATTAGGDAKELIDEVGDADLGTVVEGIETSNVTLSTLVTLAYYYDSILAGNDQPVITINGTATVNTEEVGFTVDVPFEADADLASLGAGITTAAATTAAASGGATLCSCSPTTFVFTLATGQNCDTNDLNGRSGISVTLCLDDLGGLSTLNGVAVSVDSVQFLEFDTSGNLVVINQDDQFFSTSLVDGDSFTLNSISSNLNPSVGIEDQLDLVPGGVQLTIRGKTDNGTDVSNRLIWGYTNSCNEGAVTMESGDAFGWVVIDPTAASSAFCPASAPVGSTTVATTTSAAATETTTGAPDTTTAVETTTASIVETTTEAPATTEAPEMSMSMSVSMSMGATTTTEAPVTTTAAPETTTEAPDMSMSMSMSMGPEATTTVAAVDTTTAPEEEMSMSLSMSLIFGKSGKSSKGSKSAKTLKDAKPKTSKADPKAAKISPGDRPSSKAGKVPKGEKSMSMEWGGWSGKSGKSEHSKKLFHLRRGIQ